MHHQRPRIACHTGARTNYASTTMPSKRGRRGMCITRDVHVTPPVRLGAVLALRDNRSRKRQRHTHSAQPPCQKAAPFSCALCSKTQQSRTGESCNHATTVPSSLSSPLQQIPHSSSLNCAWVVLPIMPGTAAYTAIW